jgi:heterodisulfide reductase subunit D
MTAIAELIEATKTYYCLDCGVCTGSCPVAKVFPDFSPRQIIERSLYDLEDPSDGTIWSCLTCARCSGRCPAEINFPEFVRSFRDEARKCGNLPVESHHGVLQLIAGLQTRNVKQQRTTWAEGVGTFRDRGDYFFFVGCLPFFDVTFRYLEVPSLGIAKSVLQLLNRMGIEPVISNDERCCGHDALWSGNERVFQELAGLNLEAIKASGAKTVLFSCPEGYVTFKDYYPKYFGELPFEVLHLSEFLTRELPNSGLSFQPSSNGALTYQDPCRLGRMAGNYDLPRQLLQLVPETKLLEMQHSRENALCCGTSAWMECSNCSKGMQVERLEEAVDTGANTLITACPKCQIHLTCAQTNTDLNLEVIDLYTYLNKQLVES